MAVIDPTKTRRIFVSHGGGNDDWFVVEPANDEAQLSGQVFSLLRAGRRVFEIDLRNNTARRVESPEWIDNPLGQSDNRRS